MYVLSLTLRNATTQLLAVYKKHGGETVAILPLLAGKVRIWTSNLDVARQVVAGGPQSIWFKPLSFSQSLL